MHILIGLITAIGGLVWALYRLQGSGVDLNAFNPFHWHRRRQWQKQLGTKPLHRIENPMEAAALLVVATAQLDGDITRELKAEILERFVTEFEISTVKAVAFFSGSCYLLKDCADIVGEVKNILAPTGQHFQDHHKSLLFSMMRDIAKSEGDISAAQNDLLEEVQRQFA